MENKKTKGHYPGSVPVGHDAGIDWLARQRRGQPVDWTLSETASESAAAVTK